MAVELLAFPSASARIHGEMKPDSIQKHEGIQHQSSFVSGSDCPANDGDFQREADRTLKTILLKMISPIPRILGPRQSELVPVLSCPDGGHRCPYFPCPVCHRTRSIIIVSGPRSNHSLVCCQRSNCESDVLHAHIMECEEGEDKVVVYQEHHSVASIDHMDMHPVKGNSSEVLEVPVLEYGDGGHRCPYFPCPVCHRSRSILPSTETNYNGRRPTVLMTCESEDTEDAILDQELSPPISHPDGGHRCPYFPCPICHRSRSILPSTETNYNGRRPTVLMTCESEDTEDAILDQVLSPPISHPDGGHRCPYFPCPVCHRDR